ncbi:MAG: two-component regulator propeller domain-containing protein [Bacteroidota bacterium]
MPWFVNIYTHHKKYLPGVHLLLSGLLLMMIPLQTNAQLFGLPHQERYTISSGLTNNSITDIQQDRYGFLWIGTAEGLNRFDGDQFLGYHPDQEDSSSISDSFISSLELDDSGQLWIGTQKGGITYFDVHTEAFVSIPMPKYQQGQTDFFVTHGQSLFLGDSHSFWVGSDKGIVKVPKTSSKGELAFLHPKLVANAFLGTEDEKIWVGTSAGLLHGRLRDTLLTEVSGLPFGRSGELSALLLDASGRLLVGGKKGVFVQRAHAWQEIFATLGPEKRSFNNVNSLTTDKQGRIWVAGQGGLSMIDGQTYEIDPKAERVLAQNNLDKENIHTLYIDREDNLWIGTVNNGLIRLFLSQKHFPVFRKNLDPQEGGAPENTIRSIWADSDVDIWLGTYGAGLFLFNRQTLSYTNYKHSASDPGSISGNQVSTIYRDSNGSLWVGTWGDGLNKLVQTPSGIRFIRQHLLHLEGDNHSNLSKLHKLFEDEYLNLWVITDGGLLKKGPNEEQFQNMGPFFDIPYLSINAVLEDHQGNWWIGTWHGIFVFSIEQIQRIKQGHVHTSEKPIQSFFFDQTDPSSLSNNRITSIHQDKKNRIWIGTYGGGVNLWVPASKEGEGSGSRFDSFDKNKGLPNNVVFGILEDKEGHLWLSTNNGLVVFDPDQMSFRTFHAEDGLQSDQFYFGGYAQTPSGDMIFGGTNGFNLFDPLLFSQKTDIPPQVLLTDFMIRGEKIRAGERVRGSVIMPESILTAQKLELQAADNSFRIYFHSPGFNHSQKLIYAYRLKGLTNDWQHIHYPDRFAVYSNLFEGNYQFEVKSSLDGQNWSNIRSLKLKVLAPWYRTSWAYVIFSILFLLFLGIIARLSYIYSNLRNKLTLEQLSRQQEAEINEMRLWFFTYISHEFRTPLTLIISPLTDILNNLNLPVAAQKKLSLVYKNSQRLLRLVNQILNFRLITSGRMHLTVSKQDIVFFAHEIYLSFVSLAEERRIDYQFTSTPHRIPLYFDAEKMELILYNLIGNAFKYSLDGGQIIIRIEEQGKELMISVKDRGIGIESEQLHKIFEPFQRVADVNHIGSGIGLTIVKDLTELHQGRLTVDSQKGSGSVFCAFFPLGAEHISMDQIADTTLHPSLPIVMDKQEEEMADINTPALVFPQLSEKSKMNLLVVEDNLEMRKYITHQFSALFSVLEASNGQEGLTIARKKRIDLIISDVMMPVMDGISLVRQLKEDPKTNHIPIILLSSRTAIGHQLAGLDEGAFEYITKPVNINVLRAKVRSILENIQYLREHFKHKGILPIDEQTSSRDEEFLLKAALVVERNFGTPFDASRFAAHMGMSRSGLYKQLQKQTGKSTTEFIRFIRLKHAEKLLQESKLNISQIAFQVGFNDMKYFRKCFKKEFGLSPSNYLAQKSASKQNKG